MTIFGQMGTVLEQCGQLCLPGDHNTVIRRFPNSQADFDEQVFIRDLGTSDPAGWISQAVGTYLYEIGHELQALAAILRTNLGPGSFELIVRAVVERGARVSWMLEEGSASDEAATPPDTGMPPGVRRRAIRGSFELLVSQQHYRRTLDTLRIETRLRNRARDLLRDKRAVITDWFGVICPPSDPCDPDSMPTPEVTNWTIGGETYPKYEALAKWAIPHESLPDGTARGTYGALSGWSHPNFIAAAEHLADKGFAYSYYGDYLHRLFGLAISATDTALKSWLGYYDHSHDATVERLVALTTHWESLGQ